VPRDLSGLDLARALRTLGYSVTAVLGDVAAHCEISRDELLRRL